MTYDRLHLWNLINDMENKNYFKLKIIDKDKDESMIITLDYTRLTPIGIQKAIPICTQIVTNGNNKLLFLGSKDAKIELEPLYNIAVLAQSILGGNLVWDIIDELPKQDEPQDLGGYLILNNPIDR